MTRALLLMMGLLLAGAGAGLAQGLPEGTFASTKEGCERLATKTPEELGENFDFHILSKTGTAGYGQACHFVSVTGRDATSWVATAFCDDEGYVYPDLFAIAQKEDGTLSVTRSTDSGPVDALEDSAEGEDLPADDLDPSQVGDDRPQATERSDADATQFAITGAFNTYVLCDKVKE
jgi:hypothetical protein